VSNPLSDSRVDPHCAAFQSAIDLLGRPWTALILSVLQAGALRFSELEQHTRGVGAKTLSARLKDLDTRGVIARRVEPGPPVRVYYELTAKGRAFGQVANAIERWGNALLAGDPGTRKKPAAPRKTRLRAR
jgi:DNA-binding HxlR family transcriptional regulator